MIEAPCKTSRVFWRDSLAIGVAAFAGLNLLVALPIAALWFLCAPQCVELNAFGEGAFAIAVSYGKCENGFVDFCSSADLYDSSVVGSGTLFYTGYFSRTIDLDAPAFLIRSRSSTKLSIANVRKKVGPFYKILSPAEIAAAYRTESDNPLKLASNEMLELSFKDGMCRLVPTVQPVWSEWKFSASILDPIIWIIPLVELLLLLLCIGGALGRRRFPGECHHIWQSVALALIVVFFYCYLVPLQSYYANATMFPFTVSQLLLDMVPYAVFAFLTVSCGLILTEYLLGRVVHFAIFAYLVYEYLEVGVLLREAPSFTGDLSYYDDLNLIAKDCLILAYAFIFVVMPYSKLKRYFTWMLASMSVVFVAALLDSSMNGFKTTDDSKGMKWACNRQDVPPLIRYSATRNVFVFVLDSVTSEVAKDAMLELRDKADGLRGFIAFDMNLGVQSRSELATVNIFTGEYYHNSYYNKTYASEFANHIISGESALLQYLESSFQVFCMLPLPQFNFSYVSLSGKGENVDVGTKTISTSPLLWCPHGDPMSAISIMTLSVFRTAPLCFKPSVFQWMCPIAGYPDEEYLYPVLRAAPTGVAEGVFMYCHTHGVHYPHDVSNDGNRHGVVPASYRANLDHAKSVFAELARTLVAFKEKGIYDCSTILVVADHGSHVLEDAKRFDMREEVLPPLAFPMLWVKPANSHGPIVFDDKTPTTHANIHKVLKALKNRDLAGDEIAAMLRSDRRVFIHQTRDGCDQWEVGPDGAVISKTHIVAE